MLTVHEFSLRKDQCSPQLVQRLTELSANVSRAGNVSFGFVEGDSRLRLAFEALEQFGLKPWRERWRYRLASEYFYTIRRDYSQSDLLSYEYLQLIGGRRYEGYLLEGVMTLHLPDRPVGAKAALTDTVAMVVSNNCAKALTDAALKHLVVKGVQYYDGWSPDGQCAGKLKPRLVDLSETDDERWFHVTSDFILPPVHENMELRDGQGSVERSAGVWPHEGHYSVPEITYARSDIEKSQPFDIGLTFERWYASHEDYRRLVVSRRFAAICLANGLELTFIPVHLV